MVYHKNHDLKGFAPKGPTSVVVVEPIICGGKRYQQIHNWAKKHISCPIDDKCQICGECRLLDLSNKSHEYLMVTSDWQWLCRKCHSRYDAEKFGRGRLQYGSIIDELRVLNAEIARHIASQKEVPA